ncbi:MAG: ABC transporter ATP-binding protein [Spirochaetaceae bacterium]|jgi:ABC-2 type transport system ATP-binding protein|nr:ABC transporter ATP-binding protein [Spirochaetaceae bacterium]
MEGNVLEIENIQYSYDRKNMVLTDFSLKIKRGGIVAILGHNGAGKTTLLRLIGKLIQSHSGRIQWNLTSDEKIGYMPEGLGLYSWLSGYENMKLQFLSANKKPDKELILSVLNKIELGEHVKKLTGYYSTGMKRRLSLACTLVTMPELLLMDEPFSGIDPVSQKIMIALLHEYKNEHSTFVITTHDLNLVKTICGSFVIIQNGKVVYISAENEDINNIETIYFQYAGK